MLGLGMAFRLEVGFVRCRLVSDWYEPIGVGVGASRLRSVEEEGWERRVPIEGVWRITVFAGARPCLIRCGWRISRTKVSQEKEELTFFASLSISLASLAS